MNIQYEPASILVVIPTLNEADHVEACLTSLMDGSRDVDQMSFVVADGGSIDATRDIVSRMAETRPNLTLLDNPGRLQSRAINLAARNAGEKATIMVRCDAHAVYPANFVADVAKCFEQRNAASIVVPMDALGKGATQRAVAFITDTKLGSGGAAHRGGVLSGWVDHGHHAGFRLDWFRRIGGYDEDYGQNEDAEYDRRITNAGGRIWLEAGIRLGIYSRPTFRKLARQYWYYGIGRARTLIKHRMRPRIRQVIPMIHSIALLFSLLLLLSNVTGLTGKPILYLSLTYPLAYGCLLVGVSLWASSRIGAAGLRCGVALAVMHTAWGAGFLANALRSLAGK